MSTLPSGTVTLLFSDIEGSTGLLSQLGTSYAEALSGQGRVLRAAWAAHGGTEMGTEGDSFFVVFATAPAAVSAAAQAQRELAIHPWPNGKRMRVRMGIHSGDPIIHDGGYVGMDVHRAARIAGAAHGGQVVVSDATARLVEGSLPDGVRLTFLGAHQLKDLPAPERISQLQVDGLQAEFPPLRTLGAATSLPAPSTPLVGRDGELEELEAVLGPRGVRLLTLTGPGGSGKTRLAVEVAQRLTLAFGDGVYFIPLSAVTTVEVMWTSIAEVLDVPPEGRLPPGFFTHVVHRSALFVLDNLEQLIGADSVVDELLTQAPQLVVIATSRRPLHLSAEHEHAVPPLELPGVEGFDSAERSAAVELFVQQARRVRSTFALTADNANDVAAICRRLDGLPLALELAAARTKLLSPRALLSRLDKALDITASGSQGPTRQKTLRETIAWSHDLLTVDQREFFGRLGVFSGGADLEAITAVTTSGWEPDSADALDVLTDLLDASLVTVTETFDGEPRVGMMETIRDYARDQLAASGDLDAVRQQHAHYYLEMAEKLGPLLQGPRYLEIRARFEADHLNLREALGWALQPGAAPASLVESTQISLRLCATLQRFWFVSGRLSEGRRWTERAIENAAGRDRPELALCLQMLATNLRSAGDLGRAHAYATASLSMWRRVDQGNALTASALTTLAAIGADLGQSSDQVRPLYEEALLVARSSGDQVLLRSTLGSAAALAGYGHHYQRSLDLDTEALGIARELEDPSAALFHQHNMACSLRQMGKIKESEAKMRGLIPRSLELNEPLDLIVLAEDYAAILVEVGNDRLAVQLFGAADATRERAGTVRYPAQDDEIAEPFGKARSRMSTQDWNDAYQAGRDTTVEVLLAEAFAAGSPPRFSNETAKQ